MSTTFNVVGQDRECNRSNVNGGGVVRQDANTRPAVVASPSVEVDPKYDCLSCIFCVCLMVLVVLFFSSYIDDPINGNCVSYIQIESASLVSSPPINSSAPTQSLFWTIGFSIINTEKVTNFYRDIGVQVYRIGDSDYHWTETAKVESFRQGPESQSNVVATVRAWPYMVDDVQQHMYMEGTTSTVMSFNVTLDLDVGCKRGNKMESQPPKKLKKKVFKCNDLKIEFGGNNGNASEIEGRMYGGKPVACPELSFWWRLSYSDANKAVELTDGLLAHWIG